MADGPISSRNALTATGVTDPPDIRIGIDNLQGATPASNQMSLPELGKAIGAVINKDTVAEMLALTGVPDGTRVDTARYSTSHTVGDGSDGEYVYDADSTATIDGGFVMPGVGGSLSFSGTTFNGTAGTGRWLAKSIEYPEQFGASKDIADNSSAVQRAFGSGNRKLTFKSLLPVTSAVELKSDLVLHGPGGLSRSGEVCTVSATVERLSATDFNFSGQISITAGLFKSKFSRCYFYSNGASNRCIYVTNEAIYDTSFEGSCNFVSTASQSVPLFEVDFDGQALNQVYVKDSRFDCTGNPAVITAPCVKITHQGTSANYNTNLVFENLNFEKPAAGAIHATGCLNVVCRNIGIWDMQLTGAQIDDMLQFSQTGSRRCENIMIDGYFRRQNAPSGSNTFFDINMPANQVRTVTLMNVGYRPIPTRIDLGATAGNTVEVYSSEHISIATVHSTVTLHGRDQKTDNLGNLTGAVTINLGAGLGDTKYGVLTGNATVTFSGSRVGWYTIRLTQDATGGRTVTFANIQNSPPTITATANAKTLLRVYHDGFGNYWCTASAADLIISDTVADMLALTGVPDGTRVDTARYSTSHTVGDGSGGEYVYDADSTATIDGGFVMPGVGGSLSFSGTTFNGTAGTGRWLLKDTTVANVMQFAAVGDGVTDSTVPFARAVASVLSGGQVYIPSGNYVGELQVTSGSNIRITGDGVSSKLFGGGAGENCVDLVNCTNISVSDVWLYGSGNSAAASVAVDNGLYAIGCSQIAVSRCKISNHGFAGLSFYNCNNVTASGNTISDAAGFSSNNASDIYCSGDAAIYNYLITQNACTSSNASGIVILPTVANLDHRQFVISNNLASGHARYGILLYTTLASGTSDTIKSASVVGNTVQGNGWGGIYLQSVDDSTVAGNTTRANNTGGSASGIEGGIHCNGSVGITISGNTCIDEVSNGIRVNGHTTYAERRHGVTVTSNVIRNCVTSGKPSIFLGSNAQQCVITSNTIFGGVAQAIYVQASSGVAKNHVITSNYVNGNSTANRGIDLDGSTVSAMLSGNVITACGTGVRVHDCEDIFIRDNKVFSNTTDLSTTGTIANIRFGENEFATLSNSATFTHPTAGSGDATPSVAGTQRILVNNGSATTITDFDDGIAGQTITVIISDANTGISGSSTLNLDAAEGNYAAQAGGAIFTFYTPDGVNWYEVSRRVF